MGLGRTGASLMVDDCRNRFWLLARAVGDNCSTLRAQSSTTVPCRERVCDRGFFAAQGRDSSGPTYSANYSAQGAFGGKKVPNRAVKTGRGGASTAYEKNPDPLEEPGVFVEKSRMRAEGLEPSTQGLKGVRNSKQTLQDDGMLQQLRSTT